LPKLPRDITGHEVIRALRKKDWFVVRVKGSHHHISHNDFKILITIPCHPKPLKPKILQIILKLADISVEEFIKLL